MKVGDFFEETFSYSQEDVIQFSEISGDKNPLHLDLDFCKTTIFKKPIIHGFLVGSVFSKIIGNNMPGKGAIYLKQDMKFLKPCYVDEIYKARVEIIDVFPSKRRAKLQTTILNKKNQLVLEGEALVQK